MAFYIMVSALKSTRSSNRPEFFYRLVSAIFADFASRTGTFCTAQISARSTDNDFTPEGKILILELCMAARVPQRRPRVNLSRRTTRLKNRQRNATAYL